MGCGFITYGNHLPNNRHIYTLYVQYLSRCQILTINISILQQPLTSSLLYIYNCT